MVLATTWLAGSWRLYALAVLHLLGLVVSCLCGPYTGERVVIGSIELPFETEDVMDVAARAVTALTSTTAVLKSLRIIDSNVASVLLLPAIIFQLSFVLLLQKW